MDRVLKYSKMKNHYQNEFKNGYKGFSRSSTKNKDDI